MPTISVVVPAYNAQEYLPYTVESVLQQSFQDWELIIVDDGSTDSTAEVARGFSQKDPRVRYVWQENGNQARARNHGYRVASPDSPYFLFLDSDDILEPTGLEILLATYQADPGAIAVFGQADYIDHLGNRAALDEHPIAKHGRWTNVDGRPQMTSWSNTRGLPPTFHSLVYGCAMATPGVVLIRRASLEQTGLFDPDLGGVEDWDLWTRMSLTGRFGFTDQKVLLYRFHPQSVSRNVLLMGKRQMIMRRKWLESPDIPAERREQAIAAFTFHNRGIDRLPAVAAARGVLEKSLGAMNSAYPVLESGSGEEVKRDIFMLIALDCDTTLARKATQAVAAAKRADLTAEEAGRVRIAARQLAADESRIRRRLALGKLSMSWPLLPFRKAYRLLRHFYRVQYERRPVHSHRR